jgi:hypothetical protein
MVGVEEPPPPPPPPPTSELELDELEATRPTRLTRPWTTRPSGSWTATSWPGYASCCWSAPSGRETVCRVEVVWRTSVAWPPDPELDAPDCDEDERADDEPLPERDVADGREDLGVVLLGVDDLGFGVVVVGVVEVGVVEVGVVGVGVVEVGVVLLGVVEVVSSAAMARG